jgi:hypothetical protein
MPFSIRHESSNMPTKTFANLLEYLRLLMPRLLAGQHGGPFHLVNAPEDEEGSQGESSKVWYGSAFKSPNLKRLVGARIDVN